MTKIFQAYRDAFQGLPREVWYLSAVLLVNRTGTMVLVFLALYLTQELGMTLTAAGQVLSVYGVGHLTGAFLGGWLCDRIGALRIQFASLALSGVGYLVLEHLRSRGEILVAVYLLAVVTEAFRPANGTALAALSPPHLRTRAVALNRLALNLGFSIGPAVGGWLAMYDYAWLFRVDGATCLLAALLMRFLFRHHRGRVTGPPAAADGPPELHPLRDSGFLLFLVLTVGFTFCFFQGWSTYPVYLREVYGLTESRFGLLMTLNALLILAFEMVLTHRAERFRPLTVVGAGTFIFGLGLAMLPFGRSYAWAVASAVVWTVGEMLLAPFAGGWVANRAGATHRGKYMGLYTMAWSVGFIIAPAAGAWIYQHAGPTALWLGVGGLGGVVWLGCESLARWLREPPVRVDPLRPRAVEPVESAAGE